MTVRNPQQAAWIIAGLALAGVALIILFRVDPATSAWYPPCPFHRLTGFDCPGCGSTRGLHSLLHGDLLRAADYNLLLLPALPALALGFYVRISGRGAGLWERVNKPAWILGLICVFWILRNIPGHPLSWLSAGA